jgi:CelD/BcsL family acetyltransferase involved in cellulose biosynthesis
VNSLIVERITTEGDLAALEPEWIALERSSGNTLPFRTFAWTQCWWRHMREKRIVVKDALAIRAVRAGGRLVGVAPLVLTQRPGAGPMRLCGLELIGADPNMTEIRGALCEPALEPACYQAIHEDLARSFHELDWVRWTGIDDRHGGREALGAIEGRWSEGVACYVLDLPPTWEALRASRPSNLRESLRKCYRAIERAGLRASFEVATTPADVAPALADFFRLHTARARLEGTVRHKDVFAHPACQAFLLDVCGRFAARGALRVYRLRLGDELAATRLGFVLGGCLYLYYSGFDPEYAQLSVATTVVAEAIKHAIGEGLSSVNLSTGKDPSKLRWRPREIMFREALLIPPGPLSRVKYRALGLVTKAIGASPVGHYAQRLLARRAS